MIDKIKKIYSSDFVKNNLQLISGTVIAQAINFGFNIVLTRLYAPESWGIFSLYMNIISVFLIFTALKLDIEVVKCNDKDELNEIIKLAYQSNTILTLFFAIIFYFLRALNILDKNVFDIWWNIGVIVILFLQTSYQILWMYLVRERVFKFQKNFKVFEAISLNSFYLMFYHLKHLGLLFSNLIHLFISNLILYLAVHKKDINLNIKEYWKEFSFSKLVKAFKLQQFYMWQSMLEVLQISIIPFALSDNLYLLGQYSLSFRVLQVPFRFFSMPMSQVFFTEIANRKRNNVNIESLYKKTFLMLLGVSLPFSLILLFYAPDLFSFIFGESWREAGRICITILPWIIVDFIRAPLMQVLYLFNQQKKAFIIGLCNIISMLIIVYFYQWKNLNAYLMLWSISIVQSIFTVLIIYLSFKVIKGK